MVVLWFLAGLLLAGLVVMAWRQHAWLDALAQAEASRRESQMEQGLQAFQRAFDQAAFQLHFEMQQAIYGLDATSQLDWDRLASLHAFTTEVYHGRFEADGWRWERLRPLDVPLTEDRPRDLLEAAQPLRPIGRQVPFVLDDEHLAISTFAFGIADLSKVLSRPVGEMAGPPSVQIRDALLVIVERQRYVIERVQRLLERHVPSGEDVQYGLVAVSPRGRSMVAVGRLGGDGPMEPGVGAETEGDPQAWLSSPADLAVQLFKHGSTQRSTPHTGGPMAKGERLVATAASPYPYSNSLEEPERYWSLEVRFREDLVALGIERLRRHNQRVSGATAGALVLSIFLLVSLVARSQRLARTQLDFVHGVSHELRTPLSVLRAAGSNLADGTVRDEDRITEYGQLIRREAHRLSGLVDRVLTVARLDDVARDTSAVDVADIVSRVLEASRMEWEEAGLEVTIHVPASTPHVEANASALESAVRNLVDNAIKYAASGGRIAIQAETTGAVGRERVRIGVRDWGLGVDAHDRSRLFEPFFRGRRARDEQIPGTGLGLDLVARVARATGGRVRVRHHASGGCTFSLTVPVAARATAEGLESPTDRAGRG